MTEPAGTTAANQQDLRPVVARPQGNRAVWIFAAILLAAGGGLFYALQMRRVAMEDPSLITPRGDAGAAISSPPELILPQAPADGPSMTEAFGPGAQGEVTSAPQASIYPQSTAPRFAQREAPASFAPPQRADYSVMPQPQQPVPGFAWQAPPSTMPGAPEQNGGKGADGRVHARAFVNPGTTVPQGSVIQAVMETALDSTRAGFARAIVSRDVMSFDGTRVLIPRGSRLFGNYQADVSLGQKRALIQWQRLTRPDGSLIELDSPSADPLGRAGVKGQVNTHFFQRFSGAILQSILDVGVRAATREVDGDTVIVGLPGSTTQAATIRNPDDIKPTLKIRQGSSVSVFVARDLDFTAVER